MIESVKDMRNRVISILDNVIDSLGCFFSLVRGENLYVKCTREDSCLRFSVYVLSGCMSDVSSYHLIAMFDDKFCLSYPKIVDLITFIALRY